jgi:purine-binding chemotaxis protein CheW
VTLTRPPEETLELFTFSLGASHYAVDLARVDEVLPPVEVQATEEARPPVLGVVSQRGEQVPVVELRQCLPGGPAQEGARPGLLVCWLGRRRVAFCIDGVGGVFRVAQAALLARPADAPQAVAAVWAQPPQVHLLLDLRALLRGESPPASASG